MKKTLTFIVTGIILVGGFVVLAKFSGSSPVDQSNAKEEADSSVISETNQSKSNDHIRTAIKKSTTDRVGAQKANVTIGDFYFDPTVMKISVGTTVTWTNNGMIGHDVKTDKNSPMQGPSSDILDRGESYSYTFDEPGLYLYYCSPHPVQMRAVIEVI